MDVPLLQEILRWNYQKSHVSFTFQPGFPESFCKWSTTRVYHLYKSVTRPRKPATGIKDGFEQMEHEFPFGIFRPMVLITWEIQKLWLENQIVRATPFVELQNPWSVT